MPEFATPYSVKKSDKIFTQEEMLRAIRFAIASEYEAIQIYEEIAESLKNEKALKLLYEIIGDEKVHAGNFLQLLKILDSDEEKYMQEGSKETIELLEDVV